MIARRRRGLRGEGVDDRLLERGRQAVDGDRLAALAVALHLDGLAAAFEEAEPDLGLGSPTNAWAAAAFSMLDDFADASYAKAIRQPILTIGASRDETVSTPAIEVFGGRLRAGSHLIIGGARHELMMETDRYRGQLLAAFDAFVPGTPVYA